MKFSVLVAQLGGELLGGDCEIIQVAPLAEAGSAHLSFVTDRRYIDQLAACRAGALILPPDLGDTFLGPRVLTSNPYLYFARASQQLNPPPAVRAGVHPTAVVDAHAQVDPSAEIGAFTTIGAEAVIGENARIGAHCVIEDRVVIGSDSWLSACVTVLSDCVIGARNRLHSGAVIGADGFGFALDAPAWVKIPQIGRVVFGDDVEVGANTTIDRGTLSDTCIHQGVKLDNQIQIAHNVSVGAYTAIAACAAIAGSTRIGSRCLIGGAVCIAGHLTIADGVIISGATSITKSIAKAGTYTGIYPFSPNAQWRRQAVHLRKLPELQNRLKLLEEAARRTL